MGTLGDMAEPQAPRVAGHLHQRVQAPREAERSGEMISPELVFPEEYAVTAESAEQQGPASRMLVLLDPERPIKYPLFKEAMTIGRAESADIQIDNDFVSRLHARVVSTANSVAMLAIRDPGNNYAFEVHQYFDSGYSGATTTCLSATTGADQMRSLTAWLRANGKKAFLGQFATAKSAT